MIVVLPSAKENNTVLECYVDADGLTGWFSQLLTHPVKVSSFPSSSGVTVHICARLPLQLLHLDFCREEVVRLEAKRNEK